MPRDVHLVGSVPLADACEVFTAVSRALGRHLKRIPDGETGERGDWITWLEPIFASNRVLEKSDEVFRVHAPCQHAYPLSPQARQDRGRRAFRQSVLCGHCQALLCRLRRAHGAGRRAGALQVPGRSGAGAFRDLVVPAGGPAPAARPGFQRRAQARNRQDRARPAARSVAIQFDVASAVFARLQRNEPGTYGKDRGEMLARFAAIHTDLASHVPADIELMFQFCYGDANHKHAVEPIDMGDMVAMANRLSASIKRSIALIHMPVPREGTDDADFAPLADLKLHPETELCLGLVHYTDGIPGTRARLRTAERHMQHFSVATECGFDRRDPATIPELLGIRAEIAG